ncbi:peptide ABC transporter permease [Thermococcus profundus]|uniref:Peptide ABC transporter permease n=1 Tax=Thermococcus profundus TaxID=49899 RepID=A0A2Z2MAI9_THEPR|nr:ABC transporter permease [Thermococcus profundus]ASJ02449.1 peptide ABC transporter permease [Thermococcus profundus]
MRVIDYLVKPLRERRPGRGLMIFGLSVVLVVLFMALLAPWISPYDPTEIGPDIFSPPSWKHPMGTNSLGQDVFSRIIWGSRIILYVVAIATTLSIVIGVPLGLLSGYHGGKTDRTLSMIMDSVYSFPSLILAIVIAVVLGPSPINTAVAISFVYVPTYFRMVRGQTLSLKGQLFVEAAMAMGVKDREIMRKYILPNVLPTVLVVFTLSVADAILTEAGLSFLGLSVTPPTPDWGYDLHVGQPFLLDGYWWLAFFPGIMIMLLAMGFAMIGEAINERFSLGTR